MGFTRNINIDLKFYQYYPLQEAKDLLSFRAKHKYENQTHMGINKYVFQRKFTLNNHVKWGVEKGSYTKFDLFETSVMCQQRQVARFSLSLKLTVAGMASPFAD